VVAAAGHLAGAGADRGFVAALARNGALRRAVRLAAALADVAAAVAVRIAGRGRERSERGHREPREQNRRSDPPPTGHRGECRSSWSSIARSNGFLGSSPSAPGSGAPCIFEVSRGTLSGTQWAELGGCPPRGCPPRGRRSEGVASADAGRMVIRSFPALSAFSRRRRSPRRAELSPEGRREGRQRPGAAGRHAGAGFHGDIPLPVRVHGRQGLL
jgi:hypothetical protein